MPTTPNLHPNLNTALETALETDPQAEYLDRRRRYMAAIGKGTAIFCSAPEGERGFRQSSDFYYLTGFDEPGAVLVLAPHHDRHQFILFVQPKNRDQEIWTGHRYGVGGAKEKFGADVVYAREELEAKLFQYIQQADRLYYHLGSDQDFNHLIIKYWQTGLRHYQKRGIGPIAIEDPMPVLSKMRRVKSPQEIALMQRAADIAAKAHNQAREITAPGRYEYEIAAEIEYIFHKSGGDLAYPSIVASGKNSCILHYIANDQQMQDGDLLLIDAGCRYQYYCSDITRTFPVNGKFTAPQKAIYEIVLEAQRQAIEQVKPGNFYHQIHEAAVKVITEGLVDLGLLHGSVEELIKTEKYKSFYMHNTGHWLGIDVHDTGTYKQGEEGEPLQPGQVLTVEPGIYINADQPVAIGQPVLLEQWRGIGIRIEDDVLVTSDGCEVLTAGVPKSVTAMEK